MDIIYHDDLIIRAKHQNQQLGIGTEHKVITSPSSSQSHEFSFTISLNPNSTYSEPDITKPLTSSFLDLSPADDIFFRGQLLPLHHLSLLPSSISPPSSTTSLQNFTLPDIPTDDDFFPEQKTKNQEKHINSFEHYHRQGTRPEANTKQKSFPFFGLQKWRKGCQEKETDDERQQRTKRKIKFDNVSHAFKRYVRMVKPFLSFRIISSRREGKMDKLGRQSHSFSGTNSKNENRGRGTVGYSSAPASIWTSPSNSGRHLLATTATIHHSSTADSTMEELQAAIQAAIAHCKNSTAMEHHNKNP